MKMKMFSILDEDGIYGMPFTQVNEKLASVAVVNYCRKMPFMKVDLVCLGEFDTKTGLISAESPYSLDYKKIFSDYQVELAEQNDGFEMSKTDIVE